MVSPDSIPEPTTAEQPETWALHPHSTYRIEGEFTLSPHKP